jgi:hypothetical protein
MYYERLIRLYDIDEWRKLYNLNFMNFEKIYTDCRGEIFSPYINYWDALLEIETLYLKVPPFKNGGAFHAKCPLF